jgi:hypothetical protein
MLADILLTIPLTGINLSGYTSEAKEKASVVLQEAIKVFSDLKKQTTLLNTLAGDCA